MAVSTRRSHNQVAAYVDLRSNSPFVRARAVCPNDDLTDGGTRNAPVRKVVRQRLRLPGCTSPRGQIEARASRRPPPRATSARNPKHPPFFNRTDRVERRRCRSPWLCNIAESARSPARLVGKFRRRGLSREIGKTGPVRSSLLPQITSTRPSRAVPSFPAETPEGWACPRPPSEDDPWFAHSSVFVTP